MYEELPEKLRKSASDWCTNCVHRPDKFGCNFLTECEEYLKLQAADAIEELQKLSCELLFRVGQAEALIDYYQTGRMTSNEPPKEET